MNENARCHDDQVRGAARTSGSSAFMNEPAVNTCTFTYVRTYASVFERRRSPLARVEERLPRMLLSPSGELNGRATTIGGGQSSRDHASACIRSCSLFAR